MMFPVPIDIRVHWVHRETPRDRLRSLLTSYRSEQACRTEEQEAVEEKWIRTFLKPVPQ